MKANEVRIGNYVKFEDRIFKIDSIAEVFPTLDTAEFGIGVVDWNNLEPIPLTEEWLVRFGFEFINNEFYRSQNSELCLYLTVNKNKMIPEYNGKRLVTGYDFKHVHQLQNLYFALTGEELTFKNEDK